MNHVGQRGDGLWIPIVAGPCEGPAALDDERYSLDPDCGTTLCRGGCSRWWKWRMQLSDSELWRAELGSSFRSGTSLRDYTRVRGVFSHEVTLWWSARPPVRESWSFGPARSP
jgi:hypothetical protein